MTRAAQTRALLTATLAMLTGCAQPVLHCSPCPGTFAYIEALRQPAGSTVELCLADLECVKQTFPDDRSKGRFVDIEWNSYQSFVTLLRDLDHEAMDGELLTVTLTPPPRADGRGQTVERTMNFHNGGGGQCSCSYLSTDSIVFQPAR